MTILAAGQEEFFSRAFVDQAFAHLVPAVQPFFAAAVITVVLTPVAIAVSRWTGVMAEPKPGRHIHRRSTPLLGGLALCAGFTAGALLNSPWTEQTLAVIGIAAAGAAIFVLDDRFRMPALLKLALEAVLSLTAILWFHIAITYLTLPGSGILHLAPAIVLPLSLFWLLGMQNTINMLDGIDGLAAGVVGIVAIVLMIASASRGQTELVVLAAALAGCCAGFLLFNFHPARIFMGDSGSHFLGLALALVSILGVAKIAAAFALLVPVVALAVPILDTTWAIIRRRRRGLSIAHADTRHIHHQLLDFGLSQPQTCLVIYGATGILGSIGLMLFGHKRVLSVAIVLLLVAVSTVAGEQLQKLQRGLPAPWLRRLLDGRVPVD